MGNDKDPNYQLISFVERAPNRREILEVLNNDKVFRTSDLADKTSIAPPNVSNLLKALQKEGLVNCKNPNANTYRYYEITETGKEILKEVKKR